MTAVANLWQVHPIDPDYTVVRMATWLQTGVDIWVQALIAACWSQTTFAFPIGDHYNVSFISY